MNDDRSIDRSIQAVQLICTHTSIFTAEILNYNSSFDQGNVVLSTSSIIKLISYFLGYCGKPVELYCAARLPN